MSERITLPFTERVVWTCQFCGERVEQADLVPWEGGPLPSGGLLSTLHPCGHRAGLTGTTLPAAREGS